MAAVSALMHVLLRKSAGNVIFRVPDARSRKLGICNDFKYQENPADKFSVKGSQFEQPLLEFSGACAGCGEAAYMKLATQLFGDRMIVANATGCTQAWGFVAPSLPYTTNGEGCGPALSNSLFENNAEFSLGMCLAVEQQRTHIKMDVEALAEKITDGALKEAAEKWLEAFDSNEESKTGFKKVSCSTG